MAYSKLSFVLTFSDNVPFDDEGSAGHYRVVEPRPYIDGKPLVPQDYVFDARAVLVPGVDDADRYLYTCSCGVPGCAGIFDEVAIRATSKHVTWTFPGEPFSSRLHPRVPRAGPLRVRFSRAQYTQALRELVQALQAAEAESKCSLALAPVSWYEKADGVSIAQDLQTTREWYARWLARESARKALYGPLLDTEVLLTFPNGHQRVIAADTVAFHEATRREEESGRDFEEEEAEVVAMLRASDAALTECLRTLPWDDVGPSAWPVDNEADEDDNADDDVALALSWPQASLTVRARI